MISILLDLSGTVMYNHLCEYKSEKYILVFIWPHGAHPFEKPTNYNLWTEAVCYALIVVLHQHELSHNKEGMISNQLKMYVIIYVTLGNALALLHSMNSTGPHMHVDVHWWSAGWYMTSLVFFCYEYQKEKCCFLDMFSVKKKPINIQGMKNEGEPHNTCNWSVAVL